METYPVERDGKTTMVTVPEDDHAWEALLEVYAMAQVVWDNLTANGGECEWDVADAMHDAIKTAEAALAAD